MTSMGDTEMRAAAQVSNRMLDRPAAALGAKGGDAQTRVAGTLTDLRRTVTDLDPHRADLTGARKLLKWVPGGNKIDSYFQRYASAQQQLTTSSGRWSPARTTSARTTRPSRPRRSRCGR